MALPRNLSYGAAGIVPASMDEMTKGWVGLESSLVSGFLFGYKPSDKVQWHDIAITWFSFQSGVCCESLFWF